MDRSTRAEFAADMENWLDHISDDPDFDNPAARLFQTLSQAYVKDGRAWYVTIVNNSFVSTYAQDNWAYFLASALSDTYWSRPHYLRVVLRRFEKLKDPDTHIPFKSVGGLVISDNDFQPVSQEKMRVAINTDSNGKPLPKDPTVRVVDVKELVPELFAG